MNNKYLELLQNPMWVQRSKEIREWDRNVCQCCGNSGKDSHLQVHHLYYDKNKMPWEYGNKALITLCDKCHRRWHKIDDTFWEEVKKSFNQLGENGCDKYAILQLLDILVNITSSERNVDLMYELANRFSKEGNEFLWNVWGRSHKNNMWKEIRDREKSALKLAKDAHRWANTHTKFDEDKFYDGEYADEIRDYKEYIGEEE